MIKPNKILWAFLLILTVLFAFSCKDNGTGPILVEDTSFRLKIIVKDAAGNPVSGLRISAWELLSIDNQLSKSSISSQLNKVNKIQAQTSFTFSLAERSYVIFSIFNILDQEVVRLVDAPKLAGLYKASWNAQSTPSFIVSSGVYKCRLFAKSTSSDSVLFQDSIYAVLHQPDPEVSVLGWTSQSGIFETTNVLHFPNVLDPPILLQTNSTGPEIMGTFNYIDSVALVLTDSITHNQQRINVIIGKQNNTCELTWKPTASPTPSIVGNPPILHKTTGVGPISIPKTWKLYQNYPNPFN
jgi:hypothetical protein